MLGTVASHLAVTAGHARKMKVIALLPELASHLLALYDRYDSGPRLQTPAIPLSRHLRSVLLFCYFINSVEVSKFGRSGILKMLTFILRA